MSNGKNEVVTTDKLINYIKKELKKRSPTIDTSSIPSGKITNDWEHFNKTRAITHLIPASLSFEINFHKGKYGIFRTQPSSFNYRICKDILEQAVNSESYDLAAHILQPRYRNHFTHSFLVGALGWWMLNHVKYEDSLLREKYEEFIKKRYPSIGYGYDIWDIWWLIALLHDVGYPLSLFWKRIPMLLSLCYNYPQGKPNKLPSLVEKITTDLLFSNFKGELSTRLKMLFDGLHQKVMEKLANHEYTDNFNSLFRDDVNTFYCGLQRDMNFDTIPIRDETRSGKSTLLELLKKYIDEEASIEPEENKFKALDHGIASALIASQFPKDYSDLKDDPLAQLIFTPIIFHSIKKIGKEEGDINIDIEEDFDIFFLRLVDQLQEWGRGILIEKTNEILTESRGIKLGTLVEKGESRYIDLNKIKVIFPICDERNVLTKSGWSFQFIKDDKKKAFESLKIAGKPLNIAMELQIQSKV